MTLQGHLVQVHGLQSGGSYYYNTGLISIKFSSDLPAIERAEVKIPLHAVAYLETNFWGG